MIATRMVDRTWRGWGNQQAGTTMGSLFLLVLLFAVPFGLNFVLLVGLEWMMQHEISQVVDEAEQVAAIDIDPTSYLSGSPALLIGGAPGTADYDLQQALNLGAATLGNLPSGLAGLNTWVGNPGATDPVTGQTVTVPTIEVWGHVTASLIGQSVSIAISQSSVEHTG